MTNTESIFHTMRILKAPPIPTQKLEAPTLEQLNASNPDRRAIALGSLIVGPAGLLFALICFVLMPPAPPSAVEVARANHIRTVADGPGEAKAAISVGDGRRKNPWLPDPDDTASSAAEGARYLPPPNAAGSSRKSQTAGDGTDPYAGIEIWPAGAGTHTRPDAKDKPINVFEKKDAEKKKDTRTVAARGPETVKLPEPKSGPRAKELKPGEPLPAAKKAAPASSTAAPAAKAGSSPAKLEEDDLKKPSLD